ncbi:hypothetical protein [Moritella sp. F3]|uniref:hypothetical protein n=1 Tax=Moritella sp. F3 TaxID=2718882 RepID=UPI0018E1444F|nr:hypothetical protein [Moritella sp. F3]GIC77697.1 hypothetical protein FMO001_24240 [Moritella sp. F1]GIC82110.1 hypothetical protein FMO003_23910 [Moritella sp. F3]
MEQKYTNHVIISEIGDDNQEETLYEVSFTGRAEEYGYDNQTDYLDAIEAEAIAIEVADHTKTEIVWECTKPNSSFAGVGA